MSDEVKLNLRAKLAKCMEESERVETRGENKFHHYKYAKAGDVFAEVRKPLAKHGIVVIPHEESITDLEPRQTKGEGFMYCVRVRMRYEILDTTSDEKIEIISTGEGQDGGDKGIAKAKTFAAKYAMQQLLLLPTGDDPEADSAGDADTRPAGEPCPHCGVVGTLRPSQYSDDLYCNKRAGGCGLAVPKVRPQEEQKAAEPKPTTPYEKNAPRVALASEEQRASLLAAVKARATQLKVDQAVWGKWLQEAMIEAGVPCFPTGLADKERMTVTHFRMLLELAQQTSFDPSPAESFQ